MAQVSFFCAEPIESAIVDTVASEIHNSEFLAVFDETIPVALEYLSAGT
jgi:hypothetical protein